MTYPEKPYTDISDAFKQVVVADLRARFPNCFDPDEDFEAWFDNLLDYTDTTSTIGTGHPDRYSKALENQKLAFRLPVGYLTEPNSGEQEVQQAQDNFERLVVLHGLEEAGRHLVRFLEKLTVTPPEAWIGPEEVLLAYVQELVSLRGSAG